MPTKKMTVLSRHLKNQRQKVKKLTKLDAQLQKVKKPYTECKSEQGALEKQVNIFSARIAELQNLGELEQDATRLGKLTLELKAAELELPKLSARLTVESGRIVVMQPLLDTAQAVYDREKGYCDKLDARIKAELEAINAKKKPGRV